MIPMIKEKLEETNLNKFLHKKENLLAYKDISRKLVSPQYHFM